jgi:acyl-CoA thioester hydrolase
LRDLPPIGAGLGAAKIPLNWLLSKTQPEQFAAASLAVGLPVYMITPTMALDSRDRPRGEPASPVGPHRLAVRVYYEDTDFSGVVYHASYLRFLERGRTEFLRALGVVHRGVFAGGEADGFHFVVRAMTIEFLKPALMDDELCVETHPSATGGASIDMMQKIRRGGEVLLTAKVRIAVVAGGKAKRIPAGILAKLKASTVAGPRV